MATISPRTARLERRLATLALTAAKRPFPGEQRESKRHTSMSIVVKFKGHRTTLVLERTSSVAELREKLRAIYGLQPEHQVLLKKHQTLENRTAPLRLYGIDDGSVVKLYSIAPPVPDRDSGGQVFVKLLDGKAKTFVVRFSDKVEAFKQQIEAKTGIPAAQMRLIYRCRPLEDGLELADHNMVRECTVHLVLRLRGGMFHDTSGQTGTPVRVTCALGTVVLHVNLEAGTMRDLHQAFVASRTLFLSAARSQFDDAKVSRLDGSVGWTDEYDHARWAIDESQWNYDDKTLQQLGVTEASELLYGK